LPDLRKVGVDTTLRRFLVPELKNLGERNIIPSTITEDQIELGWVDKRMLQMLFERGCIYRSLVDNPRSIR